LMFLNVLHSHINFIELLPDELIVEIYKYLSVEDGYYFSLVDKKLNIVFQTTVLWKHHLYSIINDKIIEYLKFDNFKIAYQKCINYANRFNNYYSGVLHLSEYNYNLYYVK